MIERVLPSSYLHFRSKNALFHIQNRQEIDIGLGTIANSILVLINLVQTGTVNLFFNFSSDGVTWNPLPDSTSEGVTYTGMYAQFICANISFVSSNLKAHTLGGINEIGWHFDLFGNVWGVGRNENGDESGWGSRMFRSAYQLNLFLLTEKTQDARSLAPRRICLKG